MTNVCYFEFHSIFIKHLPTTECATSPPSIGATDLLVPLEIPTQLSQGEFYNAQEVPGPKQVFRELTVLGFCLILNS